MGTSLRGAQNAIAWQEGHSRLVLTLSSEDSWSGAAFLQSLVTLAPSWHREIGLSPAPAPSAAPGICSDFIALLCFVAFVLTVVFYLWLVILAFHLRQ